MAMSLICRLFNKQLKLNNHLCFNKPQGFISSCMVTNYSQRACVIKNDVNEESNSYKENYEGYQDYFTTYTKKIKIALSGGGSKSVKRYVEEHGKMLPMDKLKYILDEGEEFLELSQLAGLEMPHGDLPRGGCITGIGKINNIYTMITINDGSLKGGTIFPITLKKQLRCQEIILQNKLPVLYVIDSGGAFLPMQDEIFPEYGGKMFYNEAVISSRNIPQLSVIAGSCTAGGAYLPMMTQESIIVDKLGSMYLGGPPLVYAALGEIISSEELGGATLHCSVSGCTDHFAKDEFEAYNICRDIISNYNLQSVKPLAQEVEEPLYDPNQLPGIIPRVNQHNLDMYQILSRIIDGSKFSEFKSLYGKSLITGFAYIQGWCVGILANNGVMTQAACDKASHFVQLCTQRQTPLVFLQNTTPPSTINKDNGANDGLLLRAFSRMMSVVASSNSPKITIIVGNSYGHENYAMCGRSFSPNFLFSWPNASVGMMSYDDLQANIDGTDGTISDSFYKTMSAFHSAQNLNDDGIILPQDTRKVVGQCLSIINQHRYQPINVQQDYPVMRM